MKFNFPFNNFASGEWSPKMKSRSDTQEYMRACEELTNMITQMQGGVQYRGGTSRIDIDADVQEDLDTSLTNPILFGKAQLLPYMPYDPARAILLCVMPAGYTWVTLPDGTSVTYGSNTDTLSWRAEYTQYTQVGDYMILTNTLGLKPKVFYYNPTTARYELKDIDRDFITTKPWEATPWDRLEALDSNVTMSIPAITNTVGSTFSLGSSAAYFESSDVGRYIRLTNGTALDGIVRIIGFTNSTSVTVQIEQVLHTASAFTFGSTANASSFWQISAWGGSNGYPRTVIGFQGRVIFGGSAGFPDTIWGSRISNFFFFQEIPYANTTGISGFASAAYTSDNSRAFTLTPNTPEASDIQALSAGKTLTIHTKKAEIVAYGSNGALGPVNVVFDSSTSFGASSVQPVRVNNFSTFVQAVGYKLRDVIYSFNEDQYKSNDLAFVADHLFQSAIQWLSSVTSNGVDVIEQLARFESKSSVLFVRTRLGRLYYVTLDRDYQVNAWGRILLGKEAGYANVEFPYDIADIPAVYSICTLPASDGTPHLYMLVKRNVNGTDRLILEMLSPAWELDNPYNLTDPTSVDLYSHRYLDFACVCVPVAPVDGVTAVWDTELDTESFYLNTEVSVVADGNYIGEFTVGNDGLLTLPRAYSYVYIGFKYLGRVKTMPLEQGGQFGQPVGRIKKVDEMVIRFIKSVGAAFGFEGNMEEIPFREPSQPMDEAVAYFSGDKVVTFPAHYDRAYQLVVEQTKPYPLYITSITPRGQTYD